VMEDNKADDWENLPLNDKLSHKVCPSLTPS
jgi:hypothetical protein